MNELSNRTESNDISYVLIDGIYYPDLHLSDEQHPIGHFGNLHRIWL